MTSSAPLDLSIVVPVLDERATLVPLYERLLEVVVGVVDEFETILERLDAELASAAMG